MRLHRRGLGVAAALAATLAVPPRLAAQHAVDRPVESVVGFFQWFLPLRAKPPACFPRERWLALDARVSGVQGALGRSRGGASVLPELRAIQVEIAALQEDCRQRIRQGAVAARQRATATRERLCERVGRVEAGLLARVFAKADAAALEVIVKEVRAVLVVALPEPADDSAPFDEADARERALLDRLDREARDPCEPAYQKALLASSNGQHERARGLLAQLAKSTCFDPQLAEQAKALAAAEAAPDAGLPPAPAPRAPAPPAPAPTSAPVPPPPPAPPAAQARGLAIDTWQSAWGDFAGLDRLVAYAHANGITSINFNPGLAIGKGRWDAAYASLAPLVSKLSTSGLEVSFLYAELEYPIGDYAEFLRAHPELGVRTLVDDSEFTDTSRDRFAANFEAVRTAGLRYAAFLTVESAANSGVSDESREWALRTLDETILMSYFSCTLDEQRRTLEPLLRYADQQGRRAAVKIALLLGGKSVGREVSCERHLGEAALQELLRGLDAWARSHASYGGLVLETNEKLPRYRLLAPR